MVRYPHITLFWLLLLSLSNTSADSEPTAQLLIAHPDVETGPFKGAVVLVRPHGLQGSVGVILNRPSRFRLEQIFTHNPAFTGEEKPLYRGGPITPKMFVYLYQRDGIERPDTLPITDGYALTFNAQSITELLTQKPRLAEVRIYNGYSGWGAGQLQREIERGDWLTLPLDERYLLTQQPEQLWSRLMQRFRGEWI